MFELKRHHWHRENTEKMKIFMNEEIIQRIVYVIVFYYLICHLDLIFSKFVNKVHCLFHADYNDSVVYN